MTERWEASGPQIGDRLFAAGRMMSCQARLERLHSLLSQSGDWAPGRDLLAQCEEARHILAELKERLERKLVVTLVGATGSGKSALLDAFAGEDNLSPSGYEARPMTRQVYALCQHDSDADPLRKQLEPLRQQLGMKEEIVKVPHCPNSALLEHVILVDTPDINAVPEHLEVVKSVVSRTDVLLCVIEVDHYNDANTLDGLAKLVKYFPHQSLYAVLNKCDRKTDQDLLHGTTVDGKSIEPIVPHLKEFIERSWKRQVDVLPVSALRHWRQPNWGPGNEPVSTVDEFPRLRQIVFETLNRGGMVVDARVRQAEEVLRYLAAAARQTLGPLCEELGQIAATMEALDREGVRASIEAIESGGGEATVAADALYYQVLLQRWGGPVGWLVGLWARFLILGTGVGHLFRFFNPLRQIAGLVAAADPSRSDEATYLLGGGVAAGRALRAYRAFIGKRWVDLHNRLARVGFDRSALDVTGLGTESGADVDRLATAWRHAVQTTVEERGRAMSAWGWQALANVWVLAFCVWVVVLCVFRFGQGMYLPADFFRHALVTLGLVWLLSFAAVQFFIQQQAGSRLLERVTRNAVQNAELFTSGEGSFHRILRQVRHLLILCQDLKDEPKTPS